MPNSTEEAALEEALAREEQYETFKNTIAGGSLYDYFSNVADPKFPADIASVMREGVPPIEMLVDEWLVPSELHLIYAEAEAWKTWVGLYLSIQVMRSGGKVAWFDEELGISEIAKRLVCLGADANLIETQFVYFPFPAWEASAAAALSHQNLIAALAKSGLQLVVYDTMTDMLAQAGLDENSGKDVTTWVKGFPEAARQLGVAQLVLDHTAKGGDTAVGSRAKRAKAKVQFFLQVPKGGRGDATKVGKLAVTLKKNTPGASLPEKRTFDIGGGNNEAGGFVLRESSRDQQNDGADATTRRIIKSVRAAVKEHGELTTRDLLKNVSGNQERVLKLARELATSAHISGVEKVEGKQGAVIYRYVEPAGLPE